MSSALKAKTLGFCSPELSHFAAVRDWKYIYSSASLGESVGIIVWYTGVWHLAPLRSNKGPWTWETPWWDLGPWRFPGSEGGRDTWRQGHVLKSWRWPVRAGGICLVARCDAIKHCLGACLRDCLETCLLGKGSGTTYHEEPLPALPCLPLPTLPFSLDGERETER